MRIFITTFLLALLTFQLNANNDTAYHLEGKVEINLAKGILETTYVISNFKEEDKNGLSFVLNDIFQVESISLNEELVKFDVINQGCADCKYYDILNQPIYEKDVLKIKAVGNFLNEKNTNRNDYKGLISLRNGILRASEQSKWYPIIVDDKTTPSFAIKALYTYELNVSCADCKNIFVGKGIPQKGGVFKSSGPENEIILIAGNYDYSLSDNGVFINLSDKDAKILERNCKMILDYYEQISGIKITDKLFYAHLPSDNRSWGGFVTFPVIVNVSKNSRVNRFSFLSHELGHFYFGDIYKPKSNLHWFYLESFAEYYSYKYLMEKDAKLMKSDFKNLKRIKRAQLIPFVKSFKGYHFRFVKLEKVKGIEDVSNIHRYQIGGFQLLGVEREIGEEKMKTFIPKLFQNLNDDEHGYTTFFNTLKEIGVSEMTIIKIQKKYFKRLKFKNYKFVEEKINAAYD